MPSGSRELCVAILGVMAVGTAEIRGRVREDARTIALDLTGLRANDVRLEGERRARFSSASGSG